MFACPWRSLRLLSEIQSLNILKDRRREQQGLCGLVVCLWMASATMLSPCNVLYKQGMLPRFPHQRLLLLSYNPKVAQDSWVKNGLKSAESGACGSLMPGKAADWQARSPSSNPIPQFTKLCYPQEGICLAWGSAVSKHEAWCVAWAGWQAAGWQGGGSSPLLCVELLASRQTPAYKAIQIQIQFFL